MNARTGIADAHHAPRLAFYTGTEEPMPVQQLPLTELSPPAPRFQVSDGELDGGA